MTFCEAFKEVFPGQPEQYVDHISEYDRVGAYADFLDKFDAKNLLCRYEKGGKVTVVPLYVYQNVVLAYLKTEFYRSFQDLKNNIHGK